MAGSVETGKIQGTVLRVRQLMVRDTRMTQAVVKTDNDLVTCMWRSAGQPVAVTENTRYSFNGRLRDVKGRRVMVEPTYEVVMAGTASKTKPGAKRAFAQKLTKKRLIIAGIVAVVALGVLLPLSLGRHNDKLATTANASEVLPPAYDANGKLIPNTPNDCEVVDAPFGITTKADPTLPIGETKIKTPGVIGQNKLCYIHGRGQFPITTHIKKPISQVVLSGTKK